MEEIGKPAPLGNILVATDFSQTDALERALRLPITRGSSITLLHVLPSGLPERLKRRFRAGAERLLAELALAAESSLRSAGQVSVDVFKSIEIGKPVEVICEQAESVRAELVVVGRTGLSRGHRHSIGATAERIARASTTPVLIVGGAPGGPYRNPLIGVDGREAAAVAELTLRVAPGLRTAVLAHAFEVPDLGILRHADSTEAEIADYVDQYARRARRHVESLLPTLPSLGAAYEPIVLQGDPRRVLLEEASRRESDLIAVAPRGHGRLLRLLLGSVSEAVVRDATIDVLIVR